MFEQNEEKKRFLRESDRHLFIPHVKSRPSDAIQQVIGDVHQRSFQGDQLHHGHVDVRSGNKCSAREDMFDSTIEPILKDNRKSTSWIEQRFRNNSTGHCFLHADRNGNSIAPGEGTCTSRDFFQPTDQQWDSDIKRKIPEKMNGRRRRRLIWIPQFSSDRNIIGNHWFNGEIENITMVEFQPRIHRIGQSLEHTLIILSPFSPSYLQCRKQSDIFLDGRDSSRAMFKQLSSDSPRSRSNFDDKL